MKPKQPQFESDDDLAAIMTGGGRCTFLLVALVSLILLYPYANGDLIGRLLLTVLYSLVLVGGAYAIGRNRRRLIVSFGLAAVGLALQWMSLLANSALYFRLAGAVFIVFLALTIAEVLGYLLRKGPVTADKLHGALAGYIMLAFFWAFIYTIVENFTPGSFSFPHPDPTDPRNLFHLVYFSFTTLTTVGYGDITPVTNQAMSFVMIEQFSGVFFVGVLIARLAGIYPAEKK